MHYIRLWRVPALFTARQLACHEMFSLRLFTKIHSHIHWPSANRIIYTANTTRRANGRMLKVTRVKRFVVIILCCFFTSSSWIASSNWHSTHPQLPDFGKLVDLFFPQVFSLAEDLRTHLHCLSKVSLFQQVVQVRSPNRLQTKEWNSVSIFIILAKCPYSTRQSWYARPIACKTGNETGSVSSSLWQSVPILPSSPGMLTPSFVKQDTKLRHFTVSAMCHSLSRQSRHTHPINYKTVKEIAHDQHLRQM